MAEPSKTEQAFTKWRDAESRYAKLLDRFTSGGAPSKVDRQTALDLAAARAKADEARDRYFKRALKR
ncbi:MAG TPA: hypothetical protein VF143_12530 [Candidatus Nanopelagicales bacterium]